MPPGLVDLRNTETQAGRFSRDGTMAQGLWVRLERGTLESSHTPECSLSPVTWEKMDPGITESPAVGGGTTAHVVEEAQRPRALCRVRGLSMAVSGGTSCRVGGRAVYASGGARALT